MDTNHIENISGWRLLIDHNGLGMNEIQADKLTHLCDIKCDFHGNLRLCVSH